MEQMQKILDKFKDRQTEQRLTAHELRKGFGSASPPIVYTSTRCVDVPLSVLRAHRVVAGFGKEPFKDAYKILRTHVMHRLSENQWNVLAITSPGEGEGKTLTAVNLAVSLAMDVTQTVLLVDADLRHPKVHHMFDLEECSGLADYLFDDAPVEKLLIHPGIGRFVFLPGGRSVQNSAEALTSPKMIALAKELKHRYPSRVIIFDLPPLLNSADVIAFSPYIDAMLLVVAEGRTMAEDVKRALQLVKGSTAVLGTVLNKTSR